MVNVKYIKLPFSTRVYRKGQKVWVIFTTGNASIYVCGRYKGWGRYVESYVSYTSKVHSDLMEYAKTGIIQVEESFAKRHFLRVYGVTDELVITEKKGSGEGKSADMPLAGIETHPIFEYFAQNHNLHLLDGEIADIINLVRDYVQAESAESKNEDTAGKIIKNWPAWKKELTGLYSPPPNMDLPQYPDKKQHVIKLGNSILTVVEDSTIPEDEFHFVGGGYKHIFKIKS